MQEIQKKLIDFIFSFYFLFNSVLKHITTKEDVSKCKILEQITSKKHMLECWNQTMVGSVWAFYVVNDNKLVMEKFFKSLDFICVTKQMLYNPRTKLRKGLISYYKTNGICKTCGCKTQFACKKT